MTLRRSGGLIGRFADGQPVEFPLVGSHCLVSGVTGSGKSAWLTTIIASYAQLPDVALFGVDPKRVEFTPWTARFTLLATDLDDIETLLQRLRVEIDHRYQHLTTTGRRRFTVPTPEMPLVVLVVDELAELRRLDPGAAEDERAVRRAREQATRRLAHLGSLTAVGRAAGLVVVCATQCPLAEVVPSDLRANLTIRIAGRVTSREQLGVALGEGLSTSVRFDEIRPDQPGVAWITGLPSTPRPRLARCPLWHDDLLDAWAKACAPLRPAFKLPPADDSGAVS